MRRRLYLLPGLLLAVITTAAQRPPSLQSPEVNADHSITFRYYSRNAQSVMVKGEFLTAPVGMTKDTAGVWSVTVAPVKPDIYPYSL